MGTENERKYLLWENGAAFATDNFYGLVHLLPDFATIETAMACTIKNGLQYDQGYLPVDVGIRIAREHGVPFDFIPTQSRVRSEGIDKFVFNMKGKGGSSRPETPSLNLEKDVFDSYWELTLGKRLFKRRLKVPYHGFTAEFDRYTNRDLFVAEVEVDDPSLLYAIPALGKDITDDPAYKNVNLAR